MFHMVKKVILINFYYTLKTLITVPFNTEGGNKKLINLQINYRSGRKSLLYLFNVQKSIGT